MEGPEDVKPRRPAGRDHGRNDPRADALDNKNALLAEGLPVTVRDIAGGGI
jgi:hypothetical protein